jgi:hypothetical protein
LGATIERDAYCAQTTPRCPRSHNRVPAGPAGTHYVSSSYFKLIDSEDFAHGAVLGGIDPAIREGLQLEPGQKTRGWVLFEIDADAEIKSIEYGLREVALPEAEDGTLANNDAAS